MSLTVEVLCFALIAPFPMHVADVSLSGGHAHMASAKAPDMCFQHTLVQLESPIEISKLVRNSELHDHIELEQALDSENPVRPVPWRQHYKRTPDFQKSSLEFLSEDLEVFFLHSRVCKPRRVQVLVHHE